MPGYERASAACYPFLEFGVTFKAGGLQTPVIVIPD